MDDDIPRFNVAERRAAKQAARERDLARLKAGEISAAELNRQNGFFSALDRSKCKVVAWRRPPVKIAF